MNMYHWAAEDAVIEQVLRRDYSFEADMWSLGVILYILLSGLPPFWGDTEEDIFKMVLKVDAFADLTAGPVLFTKDGSTLCQLTSRNALSMLPM